MSNASDRRGWRGSGGLKNPGEVSVNNLRNPLVDGCSDLLKPDRDNPQLGGRAFAPWIGANRLLNKDQTLGARANVRPNEAFDPLDVPEEKRFVANGHAVGLQGSWSAGVPAGD